MTILFRDLDARDITTRTFDFDFGKLTYISKNGTDQSIIVSTHAETSPTIKYVEGMEAFGDFVDAKAPTPEQRAAAIETVAGITGLSFQPAAQAAAFSLPGDDQIEYFGLAEGLAGLQTLSAAENISPAPLAFATVAGSDQINSQHMAGNIDLASLTNEPGTKNDDLSFLTGSEKWKI